MTFDEKNILIDIRSLLIDIRRLLYEIKKDMDKDNGGRE